MVTPNPAQKNQQEELLRYARLLWRRKWIVILPTLILPLLTAIHAMRLPDRFRSDTVILVQAQKVPDKFVTSTVTSKISDRLRTISQQIFSRTRLEKIIEEFDLFAKAREKRTPEEIVEAMRRRVDLKVNRNNSFRLSYVDPDPRTAMLVTNKLAGLFIEENLKVREQQAIGTSQFLGDEIDSYREKIRGLEASIMDFKRRHMNELPAQLSSNQARLSQLQNRMQMNSDNLNGAENRRIQIQQQLAEVERRVEDSIETNSGFSPDTSISDQLAKLFRQQGGGGADGDVVVDDTRLLAAEANLREAQSKIDGLLLRYTAKHPEVLAVRATMVRLEEQVRLEKQALEKQRRELREKREAEQAAKVVPEAPVEPEPVAPSRPQYPPIHEKLKTDLENIENEIARVHAENREIERQIEMYQSRIAAIPAREMELTQLSEDYDNIKAVLESLVDKKLQADMSESLERKQKGEQFKVLDPANLPEKPFSPNRLRLVLVALVVGCGLGGVLALAGEFTCLGVKSRNDLRDVLRVPVLGVITEIVTPVEIRKRWRLRFVSLVVTAILVVSVAGVVHFRVEPLPQVVQTLATQVRQTHWTTMKTRGGR